MLAKSILYSPLKSPRTSNFLEIKLSQSITFVEAGDSDRQLWIVLHVYYLPKQPLANDHFRPKEKISHGLVWFGLVRFGQNSNRASGNPETIKAAPVSPRDSEAR